MLRQRKTRNNVHGEHIREQISYAQLFCPLPPRYQRLWVPYTSSFFIYGQAPKKYTATEIHHEIQKLNFLGTAMYLAAHPDDENTRLIAYLANEVKARTAYLSLTRGDGGQNLIGPELRELLGVLRTQELLGARRVDGGAQQACHL